jgi:cytoskeleton protein RodZ
MNPQPASDQQDSSSGQTAHGVGRRLGAARQACGLDLARIATLLHLKPDQIESLEQERYSDLPGAVFIAGYIRNYARHVGLDPEPLVAAYRATEGQREPDRRWSESSAAGRPGRGGALMVRLVSVVVVAGLAYFFVQWWQGRGPIGPDLSVETGVVPESLPQGPARVSQVQASVQPKVARAGAEPVPPPAVSQDVPATPGDGPGQGAGTEVAQKPAAVAAIPVAPSRSVQGGGTSSSDSPGGTPAADSVAPRAADAAPTDAGQVPGDQGVVLEFRGPCWVDIRDAAKTFSLKGEMAKGDRRVLGGSPPYDLKLGNAAAVSITVNGAPFDLSRVARTNSPRFKLDPAKLP